MGYGDLPTKDEKETISKEDEKLLDEVYDEGYKNAIVDIKRKGPATLPKMVAQYETDASVSSQIRQVVFEIQHLDFHNYEDRKTEILQMIGDIHRRVPATTQNEADVLRRDYIDIVDLSNAMGLHNVVKSKMLNHVYALAAQTAVAEFELKGLSGVGAMITQVNNNRSEQKISDTTPRQPASIFDGIGTLLGKKSSQDDNKGRGGGTA